MDTPENYRMRSVIFVSIVALIIAGCSTQATSRYYGKTEAPKENVLRYISGSEPESFDPAIPNGQPEARLFMALFDSLIEYDPITNESIPGLAESWEITENGTEYLFNLRKGAKFSNGEPITAKDVVFTVQRGFDPDLASRNASLGYYIKYSEAFNSSQSFVKGADGTFLLKQDFVETADRSEPASAKDTPFHTFLDSPERLTVPSSEKARNELLDGDAKLKAAVAGKEFVPVRAEDLGVEAIDDYTVRLKLYQPAPFFLNLLGHQFFRIVSKEAVEKFGDQWTRPENIVTSGAFKLQSHKPYDEVVVVKDPQNWDAANVKLDRIEFYPLDEQTTMMNLYKAGGVDATYNHSVPSPWFEEISKYKDEYMLHPENSTEFYVINVKKAPMDNAKARRAFVLAIDRDGWTAMKKTYKPLSDLVPVGIFPAYEKAREKVYGEELTKQGSSLEEWKARTFDAERARKAMTEAGYPVVKSGNGWECPSFPVEQVSITINTADSNKATAEFLQAQWRQNLGITIPIKNMEQKTLLPMVNKLEYAGFARKGWAGDYMDPFTFLYLFYSEKNTSSTGWSSAKFDKMVDDANKIVDPQLRLEKMAEAELFLMQQDAILPLGVPATSWIKKPFVKGMYPNPGTLHAWKFVYIERDPSKWDTDADNILSQKDPIVQAQLSALKASQENFEKEKRSKLSAASAE